MALTDAQFAIAAAEIRMMTATLDAQVNRLRHDSGWTGPDADRFFSDWDNEVRGRLYSAAGKLDALVLIPFI